MTFAPGWRCTFRMIARFSFAQPASCVFSTPSTAVATSDSRTGEPFAYAITSGLKPSALKSWSLVASV